MGLHSPAHEYRWNFRAVRDNPLVREKGQLAAEFALCHLIDGVEQPVPLSDVTQPRQFFTTPDLLDMTMLPSYSLALRFGLSARLVQEGLIALNAARVDSALRLLEVPEPAPVPANALPQPALEAA